MYFCVKVVTLYGIALRLSMKVVWWVEVFFIGYI
jgi:hypothetical protein